MTYKIKSAFSSLMKPGQIQSLDGLRAIAILLVLIMHICQHIPGLSYVSWNTEWATPLYNGWIGVDLFFVLSGFLIGSVVITGLKNNTFSIVNFYVHRFFRIIPAYFFVIFVILFIKALFISRFNGLLPTFTTQQVLLNFALVTDYFPADINMPSWSLSIEEHFYLLLPITFILFRPMKIRVNLMLILIISALIIRMITYRDSSISEGFPQLEMMKLIYFPFHNRMDALSVGILIAIMHDHHAVVGSMNRHISCMIGLILVGFVFFTGALQGGFFNTTIQYTLICLGFGGLLWGVLGKDPTDKNKIQQWLSASFWVPIARISYSLYLTHLLTIGILNYFIHFKPWMFIFIFSACLLAALPLYLFIEYPSHQFARRRVRGPKAELQNQPLVLEAEKS